MKEPVFVHFDVLLMDPIAYAESSVWFIHRERGTNLEFPKHFTCYIYIIHVTVPNFI
jgi:hypothetical protein